MVIKYCLLSNCSNSSVNSKKIFICVPTNIKLRKRWFETIFGSHSNFASKSSHLYCCEDHFDLEQDSKNWMQFKMIGSRLSLKDDVVPHLRMNRTDEKEIPEVTDSQLTPTDRKRRLFNINKMNATKTPRLDYNNDRSSTSNISDDYKDNFILIKSEVHEHLEPNIKIENIKAEVNENIGMNLNIVNIKNEVYENYETGIENIKNEVFESESEIVKYLEPNIKIEEIKQEVFELDESQNEQISLYTLPVTTDFSTFIPTYVNETEDTKFISVNSQIYQESIEEEESIEDPNKRAIFENIWNAFELIQLPAKTWKIYKMITATNQRLITITNFISNQTVQEIERQIILTNNLVLQFTIGNIPITYDTWKWNNHTVTSIENLIKIIYDFYLLTVCFGGPKLSAYPEDLVKNVKSSRIDTYVQRWRHNSCTVINSPKQCKDCLSLFHKFDTNIRRRKPF